MQPNQLNNLNSGSNTSQSSAHTTLPKPKKSKKRPIVLGLIAAFLFAVGFFIYGFISVDNEPSPLERVEFENQDGATVSMLFYPDAEIVDASDLGLARVQERVEGSEQLGDPNRKMLIAPLPYDPDIYLTFSFESQADDWDFRFDSGLFYQIQANQTDEARDLYVYEDPPMALHDFTIDGSEQIGLMALDIDRTRADDDGYLRRIGSGLSQPLRTEEVIEIVSSIEAAR